jgi:hypothetical protein
MSVRFRLLTKRVKKKENWLHIGQMHPRQLLPHQTSYQALTTHPFPFYNIPRYFACNEVRSTYNVFCSTVPPNLSRQFGAQETGSGANAVWI